MSGDNPVISIREVEEDEDALLYADGFDDAIIGIGYRCGQQPLVVYDVDKCIEILVADQDMTWDEAREYFEFNVEGAWVGDKTPIWMTTGDIDD